MQSYEFLFPMAAFNLQNFQTCMGVITAGRSVGFGVVPRRGHVSEMEHRCVEPLFSKIHGLEALHCAAGIMWIMSTVSVLKRKGSDRLYTYKIAAARRPV